MATSAAAALLDELMGRSRNCDPNEKPAELQWEDDAICKYFLCGFCPHVLFTNTRADMGVCSKIHDEAIRKQYQESSRFEKMGYEEEFLKCLQNMISEVEKRIRRGHQRLALNSQSNMNGGMLTQAEEKINMLTEKINELVNQAEELGSEGKVEEAQGVLKLCDQLKVERIQIQNQQSMKDDIPQVKQMVVCEVCGAFLIVDDAPQRQDEHLMGKQHAGYARVRDEIQKRKMKKKGDLGESEQRKQQERAELERAIEKDREDRRRREKEKEDSDRRRDRDRDRDRDRRRRSRSRSGGCRSRSRERRRSGSHDHRRSKDRRRRSRSRSKTSKSSRRSRSRSQDSGSSSSRKDRDHRREDGHRHTNGQSKDRDREMQSGSSNDRERNSPSVQSNGCGS